MPGANRPRSGGQAPGRFRYDLETCQPFIARQSDTSALSPVAARDTGYSDCTGLASCPVDDCVRFVGRRAASLWIAVENPGQLKNGGATVLAAAANSPCGGGSAVLRVAQPCMDGPFIAESGDGRRFHTAERGSGGCVIA